TPLLVQIIWFYYALPVVTGVNIPAHVAAVSVLSLYGGAFYAEIVRGSIESVPVGQWYAAKALGFRGWRLMRLVILPQALRIAIAPTVGFSVQVVKGTAVTSIIGFTELTKTGSMLANATFEPFMVYGFVALG
ncbi:amino acid ABC transporter permease, partial [Pseudomonas viridiflava]|uniref:amino acid ABC transporter permease n=1 Tax=Pseudomonas viridiflava TaxID=33069 RepID=UPI0013C31CCD